MGGWYPQKTSSKTVKLMTGNLSLKHQLTKEKIRKWGRNHHFIKMIYIREMAFKQTQVL